MMSPVACMKTITHFPRRLFALSAALLFAPALSSPAMAGAITDPANDFIASFTGTHDPSLDVLSFSATFNGTTFHLSAQEAGPIAAFPTGLFVIGINRGIGASNFNAIGHGGVTFDSVLTLSHTGVLGGNVLNLASVLANISGNGFTIDLPLSSVPGLNGAAPWQYGFNLWPRDTSQIGVAQISDFAPDNFDLTVPEPLSLSLFGSGMLGLVLMRGRKRKNA